MSSTSLNRSQEDAAKLKLEGNKLFKAKKYEAAANKYRGAIDKDPSCSVYYTNLCACLSHLKLFDEMNTVASKCITIDENSVKGHYWFIMSLKKQKKLKDAFGQSEFSLEKFPDNSDLKLLQSEIGMRVKKCANTNCPVKSVFDVKDLFKCSACKETYYCSRDCQKSDWSRHKFTCQKPDTYSIHGRNFDCVTCKQRFAEAKMVHCKLCNSGAYCSQECLEKDKQRHEHSCRATRKMANFDDIQFVSKWFDSKASYSAIELSTHAMTKKQFLNKNPDFFISIDLSFSEKYCSFAPTKPPQVVYFSQLDALQAEDMKQVFAQYQNSVGPYEVSHILQVQFKLNGSIVSRRRHQAFVAQEYQRLSLEETMTTVFNHVNNLYNPLLPPLWKKFFVDRFEQQISQWSANCDDLGNFVLTSYRCQSKSAFKSPLQYTLMIKVEFGEQLGEVKRIVSYSLKRILDIKDPCLLTRVGELLDTKEKGHHLFTLAIVSNDLINSANMTVIPFQVPDSCTKVATMKEKDIDKEIRKLWKSLLKVPFPKCPPTPKYPWH